MTVLLSALITSEPLLIKAINRTLIKVTDAKLSILLGVPTIIAIGTGIYTSSATICDPATAPGFIALLFPQHQRIQCCAHTASSTLFHL
jgi:hypothetical protein